MGDYNSEETYVLEITINRCVNSTENNYHCKTQSEIEDFYRQGYVNILTKSGYLDYDDYQTPIKEYVNDDISLDFSTNVINFMMINIRENTALLSDNRVFHSGFDKKSHYSVSNSIANTYTIDEYPNAVGFINFKLDKITEEHERIVYSFLDMFGYIGGLYDFLFFFGYIFVSGFQNKLYNHEIISKLYQIEKFDKKKAKSSKFDDFSNESRMKRTVKSHTLHNLQEESKIDFKANSISSEVSYSNNESEANSESIAAKINDVSNKLKLRRSYNYRFYQLIPFSNLLRFCKHSKNPEAITHKDRINMYK